MRVLALDIGDKTIGLALSDETGVIASPFETIRRQSLDKDAAALQRVIDEREVRHVIAGLPVRLDGDWSEQTEKTEKTIEALEKRLQIEIERIDERFSTAAVERDMLAADVRRSRRREVKDQLAAAYMLQGWLDARAPRRESDVD